MKIKQRKKQCKEGERRVPTSNTFYISDLVNRKMVLKIGKNFTQLGFKITIENVTAQDVVLHEPNCGYFSGV